MENHYDINLFQLRMYIIRYGAKCMFGNEADLYSDCKIVEDMKHGDILYWMVSDLHTYLYSEIGVLSRGREGAKSCWGDRVNYKITCKGKDRFGEVSFDMVSVSSLNYLPWK